MKRLLVCILCSSLFILVSLLSADTKSPESNNIDIQESIGTSAAIVIRDIYDFLIVLNVPQVKDNSKSVGSRKYKAQRIKAKMYVEWKEDGTWSISLDDAYNSSFKVGGGNVIYSSYDAELISPRLNWIGNNKTDVFTTPTLCFSIALEPSYAIEEVNEDNSFYLMLSGKGISSYKKNYDSRIATRFKGYASGTQGCSCTEHNHKSPTRIGCADGPSELVDDAVATFGHWTAKWVGRETIR